MSKRIYQMSLPIVILSVVALVLVVQFFGAPYQPVSDLRGALLQWGVIIGAVMGLYGAVFILLNHTRVLLKAERTRGTFRSSIVVATFIAFLIVGFAYPGDVSSPEFQVLWGATAVAIGLAIEGMGGLYQLWIAYRTLRFRNIESTLLILSFALVVLWNTPSAALVFPGFVTIGEWLGNVPHTAAQRGAVICAAIGATIMGVRALIGREPGLIELEVPEK